MITKRTIFAIIIVVILVVSLFLVLKVLYMENKQKTPLPTEIPRMHRSFWSNLGGNARRNNRFPVSFAEIPHQSVVIFGYPIYGSTSVISGDFDGDGFYEFAFYQYDEIIVVGFRGIERRFMIDSDVESIASGRFISNETQQILVIGDDTLYLITNNSTRSSAFEHGYLADIVVGDLDNDSYDEAIIGVDKELMLFDDAKLNTLKTFDEAVKYCTLGNFDSDGGLEIIVGTEEYLYIIDNSSITKKVGVSLSLRPMTGDIDGDYLDEIIIHNRTKLLLLDDDGELLRSYALSVDDYSMGDMDGDGKLEIYCLSGNYNIYRVTLESSEKIIANAETAPIFMDFGNDSRDEAIFVYDYSLALMYGNVSIRYLFPNRFQIESTKLAATDIDNDGLPEIIVFQRYWGEEKLFIYSLKPKIAIQTISDFATITSYEISKYHNYSEIISIIDNLIDRYPSLIKKIEIGYSYSLDGKADIPIYAIKISNGSSVDKPAILVVAEHHARELITAESALYLIVYLVEQYGRDPLITRILDEFDVYVIPVLNVGGHDYALFFDPLRRNLHPIDNDRDGQIDEDPPEDTNNDGLIDIYYSYPIGTFWGYEGYDDDGDGRPSEDPPGGVDLNRNYNYSWTNISRYGDPSSEVYSGEAPLSEPETQALSRFMNETRPIIAISLHSGTEAIFYPWGTGYGIPPDYNQIISAVYYAQLASGLGAMQSCSIYEAAGAWDDDAYAYYGIIPFTPEIFYDPEWPETGVTEDSLGNTVYYVRGLKWYFNPKPDHILETNQRVLNLFVGVAQYAMKLIADNTPPVIDAYKVTSINGTLYLVVKAHDYESGIHYIKAIINGKTYYLIYNRILDAWTLKLHGEPNTLTIIVYNRAGLSTQQ